MRVLVVGSGGREHALAWGLARAASVDAVEAVADLAAGGFDLGVVGPEAPLVDGLADVLRARGVAVFGPSAAAARIEGSKAFAKDVMDAAGVATGRYLRCDDAVAAKRALDEFAPPYVIKADGLAAGKGVHVCVTREEAHAAIDDLLLRRVQGDAGAVVVIEEFLEGPEVSLFAVCDGEYPALLAPAQDFKRAHDGDEGPNTGGMGAYSPVPGFGLREAADLRDDLFRPVLGELEARGASFTGLLYAGLVLTTDGPKVIEFNCRFGDPEAQVLIPRFAGDLGQLLYGAATGDVGSVALRWHDDAFVTVALASGGYPGRYDVGLPIEGVERAEAHDDAIVFHAGTRRDASGRLVTAGGRVFSVTGRGADIASARAAAYAAADEISWPGLHRREDIALAAAAGEPVAAGPRRD